MPSASGPGPIFTILGWEFRRAQIYAALLLLAFLLQALWVSHRRPLALEELAYVQAGLNQFQGIPAQTSAPPSPLAAAVAAAPLLLLLRASPDDLPRDLLKWLVRLPFIVTGVLLGASVWYVARRLHGNAGGYLALALYGFSPLTVISARVGPTVIAGLGMFGVIFVSIAVSHTLYAPPRQPHLGHPLRALLELGHHRWRRIVLLGLAIALAVASDHATACIVLLALGFMFYLVPERRLASLALMLTACAVALLAAFALPGFPHDFATVLSLHGFLPRFNPGIFSAGLWRPYVAGMVSVIHPVVLLLVLAALAAYVAARRSRYFGNTAPLLVVLVLGALGVASRNELLLFGPFPARSVAFLFVFIGGIFADLLETSWRTLVLLVTLLLVGVYALTFLLALSRLPGGVLF